MKSVLVSIKPKWCAKICHEIGKDETGKPIYEKRIEVRKSAPKEVPFKAYIYCTKEKKQDDIIWAGAFGDRGKWNGHIIGEFICDYIYEWEKKDRLELIGICPTVRASCMIFVDDLEKTCLTYDELDEYGKNKTLYGWHISDLKIYDKPKELSEFSRPCSYNGICYSCKRFRPNGLPLDAPYGFCERKITRPPQSYMFVEEAREC